MKITILSAALAFGLVFNTGCSSKKDSNKAAEEMNDKKVDNASKAEVETMASDTKGDAKDAAEYLIDLANTGRAEFEMSQLAAQRAMSPAVKAYARQTEQQHGTDEKELKAQAQTYNVTLPTTLSNDSQEMLTKLRAEKAGKDFDKKYLDDMVEVNDKAIGNAKNLVSNTDKPPLKNFAQKLIADDQTHMDEAKKLHDAL